jgi:hypothetical protein
MRTDIISTFFSFEVRAVSTRLEKMPLPPDVTRNAEDRVNLNSINPVCEARDAKNAKMLRRFHEASRTGTV